MEHESASLNHLPYDQVYVVSEFNIGHFLKKTFGKTHFRGSIVNIKDGVPWKGHVSFLTLLYTFKFC